MNFLNLRTVILLLVPVLLPSGVAGGRAEADFLPPSDFLPDFLPPDIRASTALVFLVEALAAFLGTTFLPVLFTA